MPKTILLVDDDEINGIVVSHLGKQIDMPVTYANSGEEAIRLFKAGAFDFILMDIEMPGMNGLETAQAIRALPGGGKVPIIALTAHAEEYTQKQQEIRNAGMNGTLSKPPTVESLEKALSAYE